MSAAADSDLRRQLRGRLLALPPRAFELFAGDLLTFIGLNDVAVTRYSGDGGIDATGTLMTSTSLITIPTGVQVKRYRANVQRSEIDRFIGALSGQFSHGIFISTSGYAPQAARKAHNALPRIATLDGGQLVALMLQHQLGVSSLATLDEPYFAAFEAQASPSRRVAEQAVTYMVDGAAQPNTVRPEDDLISLRGLSHALRVDTTTLRRRVERGELLPDAPGPLFRRDRVGAIRAGLLGTTHPADSAAWRQEFLDFARSHNLSKSYKPVLLKALLALADREGAVTLDALTTAFRAFYLARRQAGLVVEFGPPDPSNPAVSDAELRNLIVRHPLERFLIKGFLERQPGTDLIRFAPQLWAELRVWELRDLERSADDQLAHYYRRPR